MVTLEILCVCGERPRKSFSEDITPHGAIVGIECTSCKKVTLVRRGEDGEWLLIVRNPAEQSFYLGGCV